MIKYSMKLFVPLALFFLAVFISAGTAESYGNSEFTMPSVSTSSLDNGVKLFYIKDELPQTVVYATMGYGKLYETEKNAGAAELLTGMLSVAGTSKYKGNELYRTLEDVGGEIGFIPGWENITVQVKVLARHSDLAVDIIGDVLENPLFTRDALTAAKSRVIQKIRRNRDNPESRAFSKLREVIFGGRGYGATATEESIASADLDSLKNLWEKHCRGANISIAVSSSLPEQRIKNSLKKSLSSLPDGERIYYRSEEKSALENTKSNSGKIFLVPMKLQQATIVTGTTAPDIKYQGNYALYMMNYILGGGSFNSRLTTEIRVKLGLAYSVFSLVRNRFRAGVFMTFVQTRNESAGEAISLTADNIKRMYSDSVTDTELNHAKRAVNNSFIFRFNSTGSIVSHYLDIDYNALDPDYYRNYLGNINKVTADDIKREGQILFAPGLVTVVAGSRDLEKILKKYGQVVICE